MYRAAKAVQNPRYISDYVSADEVPAAILSASGKTVTLGELTPEWWICVKTGTVLVPVFSSKRIDTL